MKRGMDRREFLAAASAGTVAALAGWRGQIAEAEGVLGVQTIAPPNIIVILADDLGYAELGVQGCKDIPTPNIDSIAANGVRFTNGYVSCPVCSPTRAGLMTGRYQQRFGHEFNPGPQGAADSVFGLDKKEVTLAERLKSSGYSTGLVGKWHLGFKPDCQPTARGFDEFFGFLGGADAYLPDDAQRKAGPIFRGTEEIQEREYLTDAFGREAVSFIDRHHNKAPFFLYLAFNAVHAPLQSIEKYLARFSSIKDEQRRTFAAMLSAMDENVGRVLKRIEEAKLQEHTLIFFLSDNGGPTPRTSSGNAPLRGYKAQTWEGGIRVPFLMKWMGHLPAGKVYANPISSLDIHPTAVAAAGAAVSPDWKLDGVNLLPFVSGEDSGKPHDALYWRMGDDKRAVRIGDWKLAVNPGEANPGLFNLADDIGEQNNLAAKMPEKLKELEDAWQAWSSQMAQPRWRPANRANAVPPQKKSASPEKSKETPAKRRARRERRAAA